MTRMATRRASGLSGVRMAVSGLLAAMLVTGCGGPGQPAMRVRCRAKRHRPLAAGVPATLGPNRNASC